jgi:hypothetical protein
MTHKETGIRSLILTGVGLMLVLPQLLMTPESILANSKKQQPSSWQSILAKIFLRQPRQPISRPIKNGDLCFISPTNQKPIYSIHPLFLWKGNFRRIAVANLGSKEFLGEIKHNKQKSFISYGGKEKLQPGEVYQWYGFIGENPAIVAEFEVMNPQQRQVMSGDLKKLERQLQVKGANKEIIALHKVQYFIDQELWSDAIQEAYSVPNPSTELSQMLRDLPENLCKSEQDKPK